MAGLGIPNLLIQAIRDQTSQIPPHMVYVIDIVSVRFGGYFTPEIRAQLQKFRNLQMLTLNDCGIISLENFPTLTNLIRLDMVFNEIKGQDLHFLRASRYIQTLMLGANKIQTIQQVKQLSFLRNLLQLDLINNPVYRLPGYRQKIYEMFPSLIVLDTLDRSGKDAYNNVTMMETINRVPQYLFSNQPDNPTYSSFHHQQRTNLSRALSRAGSLQHINHTARLNPKKLRKSNKNEPKSNAKSIGIFPVARIKRMMHKIDAIRIKRSSAVYLSAVLEYVTAQLLQIAGEQAKSQRKHRITPLILKDCLQNDEQLSKMLRYVTFGTLGQ